MHSMILEHEQLVAFDLPSKADNVGCWEEGDKYYANVLDEITSLNDFTSMTEDDFSAMKGNINLIVNAVQMSYKKMASIHPTEAKEAGLAEMKTISDRGTIEL